MRLNPEHRSDEHEDAISCCDSLPSLGRFVTGDVDGLVKIWNSKKQLIREIKFVEAVNSATFLNEQGDILVGHSGNLSRLDSENYMDKKMDVSE
jgi:WD40 repeat protein